MPLCTRGCSSVITEQAGAQNGTFHDVKIRENKETLPHHSFLAAMMPTALLAATAAFSSSGLVPVRRGLCMHSSQLVWGMTLRIMKQEWHRCIQIVALCSTMVIDLLYACTGQHVAAAQFAPPRHPQWRCKRPGFYRYSWCETQILEGQKDMRSRITPELKVKDHSTSITST